MSDHDAGAPRAEVTEPSASQVTGEAFPPASAVEGIDPTGGHGMVARTSPGELGRVPTGVLLALSSYYLLSIVTMHFHKIAGVCALGVGLVLFRRPLGVLIKAHLVGSWEAIDREASLQRTQAEGFDPRPLIVLATAAVSLTLIKYFGMSSHFYQLMGSRVSSVSTHHFYPLYGLVYWSGVRVLAYVALPWVVLRLIRGERLRDCGLATRGFVSHLRIYGLLYLIVLPPLVMVSFTGPFLRTYPFYDRAARSWADFLLWQGLYTVQFFALELFFRGFMLHPLKRRFGSQAIFIMALPYCMIHFRKPLAEAVGAFLAGMMLGTLSLRTGSIWAGVLLHASAAMTMDGLAVFHKAGFPGNPRFVG